MPKVPEETAREKDAQNPGICGALSSESCPGCSGRYVVSGEKSWLDVLRSSTLALFSAVFSAVSINVGQVMYDVDTSYWRWPGDVGRRHFTGRLNFGSLGLPRPVGLSVAHDSCAYSLTPTSHAVRMTESTLFITYLPMFSWQRRALWEGH